MKSQKYQMKKEEQLLMTTETKKSGNYKQDHSIYSGEIDIEDFNTYLPNKRRINNQADADDLPKKIMEEKELKNTALNCTL